MCYTPYITRQVKRQDKLTQPKTAKKILAGKEWCEKNGIIFEVWTDKIIKDIKNKVIKIA